MRIGYLTPNDIQVTHEEFEKLSDQDVTELFELPAPIARMLAEPDRRKGDELVAVYELSNEHRQMILMRRHDYYEPLSDMWWRVMGTAVHALVETKSPKRAETRINHVIEGVDVRGRIDYQHEDGTPVDWKFTSVWTGKHLNEQSDWTKDRPDYADQISNYLGLVYVKLVERSAGAIDVRAIPSRAEMFMIFKDWSASALKKDRNGFYPKLPFETYRLEKKAAQAYLELVESVKVWKENLAKTDDQLPECEQLFGYDRETRLPTRCSKYCPVSEFCSQFQAKKRQVGR